jgi:uncharacterized protein YkwD
MKRGLVGLLAAAVVAGCDCGYRSFAAPVDAAGGEPPLDASPTPWYYDGYGDGAAPRLVCRGLPSWDGPDERREEDLLAAVNDARATLYDCDRVEPQPPVAMDASLRCAAREIALEIDRTGTTAYTQGCGGDQAVLDLEARWGFWRASTGTRAFADASDAESAVAEWVAVEGGSTCCAVMWPTEGNLLGAGVQGRTWVALFGPPPPS